MNYISPRADAQRHIPFDEINAAALAAYPGLLHGWFPAGRVAGHEFLVGDLRGSPGKSLSINVDTGRWADFAGDAKGGDPISLAAAAFHNGDQGAAARDLGSRLGFEMNGKAGTSNPVPRPSSRPNSIMDTDGSATDRCAGAGEARTRPVRHAAHLPRRRRPAPVLRSATRCARNKKEVLHAAHLRSAERGYGVARQAPRRAAASVRTRGTGAAPQRPTYSLRGREGCRRRAFHVSWPRLYDLAGRQRRGCASGLRSPQKARSGNCLARQRRTRSEGRGRDRRAAAARTRARRVRPPGRPRRSRHPAR